MSLEFKLKDILDREIMQRGHLILAIKKGVPNYVYYAYDLS